MYGLLPTILQHEATNKASKIAFFSQEDGGRAAPAIFMELPILVFMAS